VATRAAKFVKRKLLVVRPVHHPAESVLNFAKNLPGEAVHNEYDGLYVGRNAGEVDDNLFVVAIAGSSAVVPGVDDTAIAAVKLTEKNRFEEGLRLVEKNAGSIQVDVLLLASHSEKSLGFFRVPAEPLTIFVSPHPPASLVRDILCPFCRLMAMVSSCFEFYC
jgi:hypothetical protein